MELLYRKSLCATQSVITWSRSTQPNQQRYKILSLQPNPVIHRDYKSSRLEIHVTLKQKTTSIINITIVIKISEDELSSSSSSLPPSSSQFQKTIGLHLQGVASGNLPPPLGSSMRSVLTMMIMLLASMMSSSSSSRPKLQSSDL